MEKAQIFSEFGRIIKAEYHLRVGDRTEPLSEPVRFIIDDAQDFYDTAWRLSEIARSSFVPRSYNSRYGLDERETIYESVGAHANLVAAIADAALERLYGPRFGEPNSEWPRTIDDFTYRDIMEAIRLHDLPENIVGDIPDNGAADEAEKRDFERHYYEEFVKRYPRASNALRENVAVLLQNMHNPKSPTGRILYLSDKAAALFITLNLDALSNPPLLHLESPYASARDQTEMELCDFCENGFCCASEMWAIDFFHIRKTVELDKNYFFTAFLVMSTLIHHGAWYSWRERDYL